MKIGDLVEIYASPFTEKKHYFYKNGDIGIVISTFLDSAYDLAGCVEILLIEKEEKYIIPILYIRKLGE